MKFLGHELTEESCHLLDRLERPTDVTEYASKDRLILLYVHGLVVRHPRSRGRLRRDPRTRGQRRGRGDQGKGGHPLAESGNDIGDCDMMKTFGDSVHVHVARDSSFKEGRAWLRFGDGGKHIHFSWKLLSKMCLVSLSADSSEGDAGLTVALPPVHLHASIGGLPPRFFEALGIDWESVKHHEDRAFLMDRSIRFAMHEWTLLWSLWMPTGMSRSDDPRWRRGGLNIIDAIFGHSKVYAEKVDEREVSIPMPERTYKGKVVVERKKWMRPRWPFVRGPSPITVEAVCFDVQMDDGEAIPVPGKGENGWDCGQDSCSAMSGPGDANRAVAEVVEFVTRRRRRYGGMGWTPETAQA